MNTRSPGVWYVLGAAILWGTTGTAQALLPGEFQPLAVGTVRLVIGSLGLIGWALWKRAFADAPPWPYRAVAIAGIGVAAYQPLFFSAMLQSGVAVGTIVAIGSAPLFTGLLSYLFLHEKPVAGWGQATALALGGLVLLFSAGEAFGVSFLGIFLALGAGLAYAIYATSAKIILRAQSPDALGAVVFSLAAIILLPFLFLSGVDWTGAAVTIPVFLHLGLVTTSLAYILFARGLRLIPVSSAVTLSLAEPLTAALLGILLLGEVLTIQILIGLIMIFFGLVFLASRTNADENKFLIEL